MGSRKKIMALNNIKSKKKIVFAFLRNVPISPRKMRLMTNNIRNISVNKALNILNNNKKKSSIFLKKLLLSALSNWKLKNKNIENIENIDKPLYIREIIVNKAHTLKRLRIVSKGRANQIKKTFNNVKIIINN
ncbi:MAG: 50S ribosomal protein L22 [Candidatus Bostrichicola ureolyticus]|nr:MAG: 50S ribosomal protein L22 [Candidatus Bostrichicola ureolyticus]